MKLGKFVALIHEYMVLETGCSTGVNDPKVGLMLFYDEN